MQYTLGFLHELAQIPTADLSLTRLGTNKLVHFGFEDLAAQAHALCQIQQHPAVIVFELRMLSRLTIGLPALFQPGFGPRPRTRSSVHPATAVLHGRAVARITGSRFCTASGTVAEIAGRIAVPEPTTRWRSLLQEP